MGNLRRKRDPVHHAEQLLRLRRRAALGFQIHGAEKRQDSVPADVLRTASAGSCICLSDHHRYGRQDDPADSARRRNHRLHVPAADHELSESGSGFPGSDRYLRGRSIHSQLPAAARSTSLVYDIKRVIQGKTVSAENDDKTTKELRMWILLLGVLAVLGAIGQFSLLANGFTYVYGRVRQRILRADHRRSVLQENESACGMGTMAVGFVMYLYCTICGRASGSADLHRIRGSVCYLRVYRNERDKETAGRSI